MQKNDEDDANAIEHSERDLQLHSYVSYAKI